MLCDLNFIIGDVKIKAHCAIVACRSAYLRKRVKNSIDSIVVNTANNYYSSNAASSNLPKPLFLLNNDKSMIDITINDTKNPEAFRIVLEFIYTDSIISIEGKGYQNRLFLVLLSLLFIYYFFLFLICQNKKLNL